MRELTVRVARFKVSESTPADGVRAMPFRREVIFGFPKFIRLWRINRFTRLTRCAEKTDKLSRLLQGELR
jgi:hypothetical protein